jgi:hypothetical protein
MARKKEFQEEPYDIFANTGASEERSSQSVVPFPSNTNSFKDSKPEMSSSLLKDRERKVLKEDIEAIRIIDEPRVRHTLELESSEQEREYQAFEARLRQRFGSGVTFSVLGRALFTAMLRAEDQVSKTGEKMNVPSASDRKNPEKAAEYQEVWNRIMTNALVAAAPMPRDMKKNG